MVFFVVTRQGYDELRRLCVEVPTPLWAAKDALSEGEIESLRAAGANVSIFSDAMSPDDSDLIEGSLWTIAEHHPGERIWVERTIKTDR